MKRVIVFACLALLAAVARAEKTPPKIASAPSPGYLVKADGGVADPKLAMATHRAFGRAAMAAITAWRFEPATLDGTPIDQKVSVPFHFTAPLDQTINAAAKRKVFVALTEPVLTDKDFPTKKLKAKRAARPVYPRALFGSGVEEKVQVKFVVAPDGTTLNPALVVPPKHKEFEAAALQAVALAGYEPPLKDGKPVYVEATTTLNFTNERPDFGDGGFGGGRRGGGRGGGMGGGGFGGEGPGGGG